MKDVVLNEERNNDKLKKILVKICLDLKINDYEKIINDFLEK